MSECLRALVSVHMSVHMHTYVCVSVSVNECVGAGPCVIGAGGGPSIGNVYTNQQTPSQPWDPGSHPSLSHIVYKVEETHRQRLLSSLIYSSSATTTKACARKSPLITVIP